MVSHGKPDAFLWSTGVELILICCLSLSDDAYCTHLDIQCDWEW